MKRRGNYSTWLVLGAIGALVAAAALVGNGNIKPTHEAHAQQCHYSAMATGSEELGMNILGPTYLHMQETTAFEAAGPYQGRLEITPDQNTALGATENISCDGAGQQLNLTKSSGPLALYAKNCSIHPGEVAFSITMPDECRRNDSPPGISYWGLNMGRGDAPLSVTPNNGECDCSNQGNGGGGDNGGNGGNGGGGNGGGGNSGGGGNNGDGSQGGGIKYGMGGNGFEIPSGSTGDPLAGDTNSNLAIGDWRVQEAGPYNIAIAWASVIGATEYRILVEHYDPASAPADAGQFPPNGWSVAAADTGSGRRHSAVAGGQGAGGFYPGGRFNVRLQAVGHDGSHGPPSEAKSVTTYHATELGTVRNLRASEREGGQPGFVTLTWLAAPGQRDRLAKSVNADEVLTQFRRFGIDPPY